MIKYSLQCSEDHRFEAWFESSSSFDDQLAKGFVSCPVCGTTDVHKMLMTPGVSTGRRKDARKEAVQVAALSSMHGEMRAKLKEVRDHIHANTEDVGAAFPEEARKIHYGEAEQRGIRGAAAPEEVKSLVDEGVEIAPVPELPDDAN
ncbi:MAG: DUF1178 family protein [Pseudomonadota bacterium]